MIKNKEAIKNLESKGFVIDARRSKSNSHTVLQFYAGGKKTRIRTRVSHGTKSSIHKGLIGSISKQLMISNTQCLEFLRCNLSEEEYIELVKEYM